MCRLLSESRELSHGMVRAVTVRAEVMCWIGLRLAQRRDRCVLSRQRAVLVDFTYSKVQYGVNEIGPHNTTGRGLPSRFSNFIILHL